MNFEKSLDLIKKEFQEELGKRIELLDRIAELNEYNEQLKRDLRAFRSLYTMKNEVCAKCMFADECMDEGRVEGRQLCTSFHAKIERGKKDAD